MFPLPERHFQWAIRKMLMKQVSDAISLYTDHIILQPDLTFDGNGSYHLQEPPLSGDFSISQAYQSSALQQKENFKETVLLYGWRVIALLCFHLLWVTYLLISQIYILSFFLRASRVTLYIIVWNLLLFRSNIEVNNLNYKWKLLVLKNY